MRRLLALLAFAGLALAQQHLAMPDPKLTPGKVRTSNAAEICDPATRTLTVYPEQEVHGSIRARVSTAELELLKRGWGARPVRENMIPVR